MSGNMPRIKKINNMKIQERTVCNEFILIHKTQYKWFQTNRSAINQVVSAVLRDSKCSPRNVSKMLRHLSQDLRTVQHIVVGQDPYPNENLCTGRAFEPDNYTWDDVFNNKSGASFRNLIQRCLEVELGKTYPNGDYKKTVPNSQALVDLQNEIAQGNWAASPKDWFDYLESKNVFFVNAFWTAPKHRKIWKNIAKSYFEYVRGKISTNNFCFIMGGEAKPVVGIRFLSNHQYVTAHHPSPSAKTPIPRANVVQWKNQSGLNLRGI